MSTYYIYKIETNYKKTNNEKNDSSEDLENGDLHNL